MNIRDLKYLVAVAEHKHFGKAAEACFVSQPTLSTQIKKLEEELGVTLIERNNKSVLLTEAGKVITEKAEELLQVSIDIKRLAENYNNPEASTISLGVIPTLGPYLLPHIMPAIKKHFPKLRILLYEEQTAILLEKLNSGKLDAALLALPIVDSTLQHELLFDEPFLAAIPSKNNLADKKQITLKDMHDQDVLLLEDGHCLRDQTLDLCNTVGISEIEGYRATSLETLRQMVATGLGVTFIPAFAAQKNESKKSGVTLKPFKTPEPYRSIALTFRNSSYQKPLLSAIAKVIRQKADAELH